MVMEYMLVTISAGDPPSLVTLHPSPPATLLSSQLYSVQPPPPCSVLHSSQLLCTALNGALFSTVHCLDANSPQPSMYVLNCAAVF